MAIDYYLKLDGIEGESKKKGHEKQFEILGWSFSGSNPVSAQGGGMSAGKVSFSDISFQKRVDKASTKLLNKMATGDHFKEAVLYCAKSTGEKTTQDFLVITMKEAYITSYSTSGSGGGGDYETESFSVAYGGIEVDYKVQGDKGTLTSAGEFEYNVKTEEVLK
jgi:type VI secretion system secreted protein Hcp